MKRSGYAAALLALALVAATCGDDGGTLFDQSSETPFGTEASGSIDDLPTDVGDLPGVSNECEALLNLFLSIGGAFVGGPVSPLDPGVLSNLPPAIQADAQYLSQTLAQFSAGLQDLGLDLSDPTSVATMTPAQQEAFTALTESLDTEQFNAAADNLSAYGEQQCASQFGGLG